MAQKALSPVPEALAKHNAEVYAKHKLGALLCWAVVFADIGTSIYYVPGILYGMVGKLAGFFVLLTMIVFVLLTFKYTEVTYRFPQGGGVVTVATQALNRWFGALGGMLILVDYFLTASISCLSGMLYLSVVVPLIDARGNFFGEPIIVWITIGILILLGLLNCIGISESAKVSLVGACVAFVSDIAILLTVFTHLSFAQFLGLFSQMIAGHILTPITALIGFSGAFLAFSGLESISQLSPAMKMPRKGVSKLALLLVVLTVGLTSPLLTMFSTLLLPQAAGDPIHSAQLISLLAGHWGSAFLQIEVAISASALLVFASNTAIIGSYHVFLALSRMDFMPVFILQQNRWRNTPHYAIGIATVIPILVLLLVRGNINVLGDMYAFGLLGAFTLTCISIDIVRYRLRKARKMSKTQSTNEQTPTNEAAKKPEEQPESEGPWMRSSFNFWLGILTTILVVIAWMTNLIAKPLATEFGGSVACIGMVLAYFNYKRELRKGRKPVAATEAHSETNVH